MRRDTTPVTASAKMKGSEVTVNAFTAAPSFPPFHGLLFDDHTPATARMTAKITATTGLWFASTDGSEVKYVNRYQ